MLTIAGVAVQRGDQLWVSRAGAYGTVVDLGENIGTITVVRAQGSRSFTVEQGGFIAGARDVYWQAPIQLDLPKGQEAKRQKIDAVVTALLAVL